MPNPPTKPTRRSREDWSHLIEQYESGDATQRAFCEQKGVTYSSFCYWRKRLRHLAVNDPHPAPFVELPMLSAMTESNWRVEVHLGQGMILRLK